MISKFLFKFVLVLFLSQLFSSRNIFEIGTCEVWSLYFMVIPDRYCMYLKRKWSKVVKTFVCAWNGSLL